MTSTLTNPQLPNDPGGRALGQDRADGDWLTRAEVEQLNHAGYPRQPDKLPTGLDAGWQYAASFFAVLVPRKGKVLRDADKIDKKRSAYEQLGVAALREQMTEARIAIRRQSNDLNVMRNAIALIAVQADRTLGLRPYPVQLAGAWAMAQGMLAEMATGEGKTLTASLTATLLGWRGRGCHVVTVNDYLAQRDAETLRPLYKACGLDVQHVDPEMPPTDKHQAYRAGITYATNKELNADFLRDHLARQARGRNAPTVMRELWYAIVDEADSVLIDEAATPLIISSESGDTKRLEAIQKATRLVDKFEEGLDYRLQHKYRQVEFTSVGRKRTRQVTEGLGGLWDMRRIREELINQAISARDLHLRNRDYIVIEDKIVIVDPSTGRQMPDRTWSHGIHQAVEAKEGLELKPINETLARMSFQRFFRSYRHLAGMTGTAWEARHELWRVYNLSVVRIPTNRPNQRKDALTRVCVQAEERYQRIVEEADQRHRVGQPVLIGTSSVKESEILAELLTQRKINHQVLNALTHEQEAAIVSLAGRRGMVTVATNMAGRGTDISLGEGIAEMGGLHVIAASPNKSRRVDRQLLGRCARQGDPGTTTRYASLDDDVLNDYVPRWQRALAEKFPQALRRHVVRGAQSKAEQVNRMNRRSVLRSDDWLDRHLGFAPENT